MKTFNRRQNTWSAWSALVLAALLLAGCGGGSGGGANNNPPPSGSCATGDCGTLLVGVTDADGDFLSYSVDVLSITLQRPNGASVETLPATTRIDFAQLTDLADLLSVTTLAPGDFVGGKIRLDYTNAEVFVESGGKIVAAKVVDANGQALGVTELEIKLADRNHLVITRGRAAFLSLDFDLAASNEVDLTKSPVVVTAKPFIVAEVQPVTEKEMRLRGALVSVDSAASTYTIDVRPWHLQTGDHGRFTVHTTAQTSFEIAGSTTTGAAGLTALSQQPAGTLTVAFGKLDLPSREFTASIVQAGDSVSGERLDAVHGSVVARSGDQLTVKGAFAVRRDHAPRFHRTVLVQLGPNTKVLKVGSTQLLDIGALSVGQNIVAFGTFSDPPAATPTNAPTLDATAGRVRMLVTQLHGAVLSTVPGQLNMKLRGIDHLGVEMFDFRGTGVTAAMDADPNNYEVATGTLGLAALAPNEATKVLGFVRPFGSAPADFDGRTVIDRRDLPALLGIGWGEAGTSAPFLSIGVPGIVLDLGNPAIGMRHHLVVGGMRVIDLKDLAASPTIAPASGRTMFGLWEPGHVELFADFGAFTTELSKRLAAGDKAQSLVALGSYDEGANTLTANHIAVHLESAD